jgi:transcription factor MBP1
VDLAERYHVKELLQPIIEFQPTSESPPLAPKHITAASNKPRKPREPKEPKPIKPRPPKKTKKVEPIEDVMEVDSDHETNEIVSVESNTNVSVSPISSLTTTPAPVDSSNDLTESDDAIPVQKTKRKRKQSEPATASNNNAPNRPSKIAKNVPTAPVPQYQQYEMLLWSYFTTNNGTSIPDFIINPPSDFDPNIVIDQQGHTALHWAAAMANLEMTHLLSKAGSDLDRGNIHGETALMRSVMFPYNYDHRCFNDMVQILHTTIPNLDINDQTVLHHVAIFASSKGRIGPSKYYMEILLSHLALHPNEEYRKAIINKQNHEGDTALNISARFANKKLVRLLMDAGADPQIRNAIGKNAEDYILELDHEAKSRITADHHQVQLHNIPTVNNIESQEPAITSSSITDGTTPATSSTGVQISQNFIPSITSILQEFENSYQLQIQEKERELSASRAQLDSVSNDLNKTKNVIDALRDKIRVLPARKERINDLVGLVKEKVEKRRQRRLDATISEEMKNAAPFQGGNAEK